MNRLAWVSPWRAAAEGTRPGNPGQGNGMVIFRCPTCKAQLEHPSAGEKVTCSTCGQCLLVPAQMPNQSTVAEFALAQPRKDAGPVGPAAPLDQAAEVVVPDKPPLTLRCNIGHRLEKFRTRLGPKAVHRAVDDLLYRLGLSWDREGEVHGSVRHSYTFFCASKAKGYARIYPSRDEFILDISVSNSMPVVPILLAIFLFPVGLVLALVFYFLGKEDADRLLEQGARDLRDDLTGNDRR